MSKPEQSELAPIAQSSDLVTSASMSAISPIQQMQQMKAMGFTVEDMREMLVLQKEYEANEAEKSFNLALADFKAESISIIKDKTVLYKTDKGTTTYDHATLGGIVETVVPFLSKHGLSHRWSMNQADGGIHVTCILTHKAGHSETCNLHASPDMSGGKNSIQGIASTITYLQRYTFLAITGLAAKDQDDDGAAHGFNDNYDAPQSSVKPNPEKITQEQCNQIHARMTDNGLNVPIFMDWVVKVYHVEKLSDLTTEQFPRVMLKLTETIKKKNEANK